MSHMPRKKHKLKKKEREREKPGNMQDAQGKNNRFPIAYQRHIGISLLYNVNVIYDKLKQMRILLLLIILFLDNSPEVKTKKVKTEEKKKKKKKNKKKAKEKDDGSLFISIPPT